MSSEIKWLLRDKPRLIVFDVEGVLIPKNRFLFEVGKKLGFIKLINLLFYGFLYEAGLLKLESALTRAFRELRGVKPEELMLIFNKIASTAFLQTLCRPNQNEKLQNRLD